jgi:hypothetical protein
MKQTKPAQAMELRSLSPVFAAYLNGSATEPTPAVTCEARDRIRIGLWAFSYASMGASWAIA